MKILDRYVIWSFIKNYLISTMVLMGMYVVLDMVFNFSNLVDFQPTGSVLQTMFDTLRDIGDYYFYQCFLFFVHLSGIIPVVAAAFTLMRFSRFNELTAMLAAGVPLLRIAMPIILAGVVLNVFVLIDQELVIPRMIPKLTREHNDVHRDVRNYYAIQAMQDSNDGLLYAARYFPSPANGPPYMEDMDVIERAAPSGAEADAALEPIAHLYATKAVWDAAHGQWDLTDGKDAWGNNVPGKYVEGLRPTQRRSEEKPVSVYKSNVSPEEIALYRSGNFVDLLSTDRINQLLARPKSYGTLALLRVKHWRFTQPLMNVILLLLAIPCVLTREPGRLKQAATKCLVLTGLAMGSIFLSQQFAGNPPPTIPPDRWAAIMAWAPVFIFGPLSVFLLDRVQT